MQTIEGFAFFPLVFDTGGKLEGRNEFDALVAQARARRATDAVFIAHGFRNDVGEATTLYTNFLKNFSAHLTRPQFQVLAARRFVVAGVYWTSKAFRETFEDAVEGTCGLHNPTLAMADAKQRLEELKVEASPAQRRSLEKAAALLPKLEGNPKAQDEFVKRVLSVLSHSRLDETEGLPQLRERSASELLARLDPPPPTAPAGSSARSPARWASF